MGAMLLASALNRSISPGISKHFLIFPGGECLFRALAKNMMAKSRYYKERNVQSKKRKAIRR